MMRVTRIKMNTQTRNTSRKTRVNWIRTRHTKNELEFTLRGQYNYCNFNFPIRLKRTIHKCREHSKIFIIIWWHEWGIDVTWHHENEIANQLCQPINLFCLNNFVFRCYSFSFSRSLSLFVCFYFLCLIITMKKNNVVLLFSSMRSPANTE